MTTIVFDGKYLAADTRGILGLGAGSFKRHCTECDSRIKHTHVPMEKIHVPSKKTIFEGEVVIAMAGAGSSNMAKFMIYMVETHPEPLEAIRKLPKTTHQESSAILILTEQNVYTLSTTGHLIKHMELPVAIGTGSQAALLAVKEGANAMIAIRKASLVDDATNAKVDFIRVVQSDEYHILRHVMASDNKSFKG